MPISTVACDSPAAKQSIQSAYWQLARTSGAIFAVDLMIVMGVVFGLNAFGLQAYSSSAESTAILLLIVNTFMAFLFFRLYGIGVHPILEFRNLQCALCVAFVSAWLPLYWAGSLELRSVVYFAAIALAIPVVRSVARRHLCKTEWWGVRCLVYHCGQRVNSLYRAHLQNAYLGLRPVGYTDSEFHPHSSFRDEYVGTFDHASLAADTLNAPCALVHLHGRDAKGMKNFIRMYLSRYSWVVVLPDDQTLPSLWAMGAMAGMVKSRQKLLKPSNRVVKRSFDVVLSMFAVLLFAPVIAIQWCRNLVSTRGTALSNQAFLGRNGVPFRAFRATTADSAPDAQKVRRTFRSFVREIPLLWNVLKGDMSFVGPALVRENPEVPPDVNRFRVQPGLTGFWRLAEREASTTEKRRQMDEFYINEWTIWLDMLILWESLKYAIRGDQGPKNTHDDHVSQPWIC